ncbi:hypothetical protein [Evansella halocellulosilytica]|uniref:hypothetical protein n=1 Tax=Evansella halocellulosilytica TaxID=2011013 RepID=UPI000BB7284A|nr:hypothetical protein [Evansella halocellulosilytica]
MVRKELEIRGIHRKELIRYLQQLGGTTGNKGEVIAAVTHEKWACHLSDQTTFRFLQSDIPKVIVTFTANDQDILNEIVATFRKKTFRAGG